MALVKEYFDLTQKYKNKYGSHTVLYMQVGAFFEVYGLKRNHEIIESKSDITKFSKICDLMIADKKICVGEHGVVMAGFRDYMIDKYISKMQENGYTIVVYKQDQQSKNTTRSIAGVFSPGTTFCDDVQEESRLSNNIMCIWIHKSNSKMLARDNINIGLCNIDVYTGKTNVFEIETENYKNPTSFDELEQCISIYNPSECIFIYNMDEQLIDTIIQYIGLRSKKSHKISILFHGEQDKKTMMKNNENVAKALKCENQVYQSEILKNYYNTSNIDIIMESLNYHTLSLQSLCFLLEFVHDHNPSLVDLLVLPQFDNNNHRCILANHSLKQLNILSQHSNEQFDKYTLERLINKCKTNMGKRKFRQILLNPICDVDKLNESYRMIGHVYAQKYIELWEQELTNMRDVERLQRKSILRKLTPQDFYCLYENLTQVKKILKHTLKDKMLESGYETKQNTIHNNKLLKFMDAYFDIKKCKSINTTQYDKLLQQSEFTNFIKPGNFENYDICLANKSDYQSMLEAYVDKLSLLVYEEEQLGKKTKTKGTHKGYIKIHSTPTQGICLLITKKRSTLLKSIIKKMQESGNTTFNVKYVSKYNKEEKEALFDNNIEIMTHISKNMVLQSKSLNDLINNIMKNESEFITQLCDAYMSILNHFSEYDEELKGVSMYITNIDVLYCKVKMIDSFHLKCPVIQHDEANQTSENDTTPTSYVNVEGLRHLIVEKMNQDELYISNDVSLHCPETENGPNGILLFGTNAVGKTSFIKSLGISIIMAQAGLYVPCSKMTYYPYTYVFTRILGNDNIFKGLSTFAVEMSELRVILNKANKNSLILGDELCSGTENESAMSIFVSSLEELYHKNSSFIFATHFHEIVGYDEIQSMDKLHCKHMRVKYNNELKRLEYDRKLCDGSGEPIYGLEVCKSLRMPQDFLERAYELRNKYGTRRDKNILNMKISKYNRGKLRSTCEFCKKEMGTEIHHLQYQKSANQDDHYIESEDQTFHKNHSANLSSICEKCHDRLHELNLVYTRQKTSYGYELVLKES